MEIKPSVLHIHHNSYLRLNYRRKAQETPTSSARLPLSSPNAAFDMNMTSLPLAFWTPKHVVLWRPCAQG